MKEKLAFLIICCASILFIGANSASLQLSEVELKSYPTIKDDGRNWDTWGGPHPDVYLKISDSNGDVVYNSRRSYVQNLSNEDLPYSFHPRTSISFTKMYYLEFYDLDDRTEDDLILRLRVIPSEFKGVAKKLYHDGIHVATVYITD